jgi:hypothetical protein
MNPQNRYRNAVPSRLGSSPVPVEEVTLTGRRVWPADTKTVELIPAGSWTTVNLEASRSVEAAVMGELSKALELGLSKLDSPSRSAFLEAFQRECGRAIRESGFWPLFAQLVERGATVAETTN